MYKKINYENYDIIFWITLFKNGVSDDDTFVTLVGNYIFSIIGKLFFKLNINDILYTFVLGKTKLVNQLNLKKKILFCVELPIKARKKHVDF